MIGKKIYRLTNLELYDVIINGSDQFAFEELQLELDSRELTLQQIAEIEVGYLQYKEIQQKRSDQSLTTQEYLM